MLEIKGIDMLVGCSCDGWDIQRIYEAVDNPITGAYYVIDFGIRNHFRMIRNQKTEIFLCRTKYANDKYEMFVMGWGGSTKMDIDKIQLKEPETFLDMMTECLKKINK